MKIGDRVVLISTTDTFTELVPGDKGTITNIGYGVVSIVWDCGSFLGMVMGEDEIKVINREDKLNRILKDEIIN